MTHPIEFFPDGTGIGDFFYDESVPDIGAFRKQYTLEPSTADRDMRTAKIQAGRDMRTSEIQALIDRAHSDGGGVLVIPAGTYHTGALFLRPGVHLYLSEGATLIGSDDVCDYPLIKTRIEGETCLYFSALINADRCDGFTIFGKGTIDGNGLKSWKHFWLRRTWNPACTNKDEQRPRLLYVSNSDNVTIAGVTLKNSHFWTSHYYRCSRLRILGVSFYSPTGAFVASDLCTGDAANADSSKSPAPRAAAETGAASAPAACAAPDTSGVAAPSTDAIDLDVCSDVHIKSCYMEVNDDAVALKGGKGPDAASDMANGSNERILIEDCEYGFCHSCLTAGSESLRTKNVILRRSHVSASLNLLWLKLRPDTLQHYEYITVEDIEGNVDIMLDIFRWSQFADPKACRDGAASRAEHITLRRCKIVCKQAENISDEARPLISDLTTSDLEVTESGEAVGPLIR
ncbi:MAG: glycosyl hydrolase family 28 protein [Eubacteriales bacterium]|nr:glycosyl hydrolase family 28 protein [Eubacteriales bacterium]